MTGDLLHQQFLQLLEGTPLNEKGLLVLNIMYCYESEEEFETRYMIYNFKEQLGQDFIKCVKRRMADSDVVFDTIRVTKEKILIKDQQDAYGAFIHHALETPNSFFMDVYLSDVEKRKEELDDDDNDNEYY